MSLRQDPTRPSTALRPTRTKSPLRALSARLGPVAGAASGCLLATLILLSPTLAQDPLPVILLEGLPGLPTTEPQVQDAVPVRSEAGELLGAAWLDGRSGRELAVAFAPWNGTAWGPRELVAPPAAGSQLALTAAALPNGEVLLAWSGFDGEDDEILWSRRRGATWSPPARLAPDNGVPDITPALVATGARGGEGADALAAWSRYQDGHYRVVIATFDGRSWSEPVPLGPPGSLFPSFTLAEASAVNRGAHLLFRTARPRGWQIVELDTTARPRRSAQALTGDRHLSRPQVTQVEDVLRFSWDAAEGTEPAPRTLQVPWENLP